MHLGRPALQHVKTGRLVALATTGPQRLAILPHVPTLSETLPGVEIINWFGAFRKAEEMRWGRVIRQAGIAPQ